VTVHLILPGITSANTVLLGFWPSGRVAAALGASILVRDRETVRDQPDLFDSENRCLTETRRPGAGTMGTSMTIPDNKPRSDHLERYRSFLQLAARLYVSPALQGKLDASDIVQQTLLQAVEKMDQFKGANEAEMAGWLRQILVNNLAMANRRFRAGARDVSRERSLDQMFLESSARIGAILAADMSSPSGHVMHEEQLLLLADALAQLPEDQRRATELHHLMGYSVAETAEVMQRGRSSVVGLLFRALKKLREQIANNEEN
jgi:RNA polymerase sigma-70 factor, ECF subfamily